MEGARPASTADLDVVAALAELAITELTGQRGGSIWTRFEARRQPVSAGLSHALTDDDQLVVVGTFDDVVVGYGAARIALLHDGEPLGIIGDLYVLPDARGVGVGEAMMNQLIDWCRERNCVGVDSLALPGDRATKNFFETFGLVARSITVHRRLQTP